MTVVVGRGVRRAKTITLRPMAVIAIPILMELKQIPLPVSLLTRFKNPSGLFAAHKEGMKNVVDVTTLHSTESISKCAIPRLGQPNEL